MTCTSTLVTTLFDLVDLMTKVRTVIPANATPGKSLLQVVNPKTGKPVRVKIPADAVPGALIELQLPDDPTDSRLPPTASTTSSVVDSRNRDSSQTPESSSVRAATPITSDALAPVSSISPPTQQVSPPPFSQNQTTEATRADEKEPLLDRKRDKSGKGNDDKEERGSCTACLLSPLLFVKSLCG